MEYLLIIVVTVVIALLDDRIRGRKKVPPPTVPQDIPRPQKRKAQRGGTFEIPPMRGIPGTAEASVDAEVLREQELRAKWEEARRAAEREKRVRQREEQAAQEQTETVPAAPYVPAHQTAALLPRLTPDAMKQAIVLAEVLGRPRALRRFPRR